MNTRANRRLAASAAYDKLAELAKDLPDEEMHKKVRPY